MTYSSDLYFQLCVASEKVHVVVHFDCSCAVTFVSESDLQAFCLSGNLQEVFSLFLSRIGEKLT